MNLPDLTDFELRVIESLFSTPKHFRGVAARYDKLAVIFLAIVPIASTRLWLRA